MSTSVPFASAPAEARVEARTDSHVQTRAEARVEARADAAATHALFAPMLLLALAVVGWFGFQTYELARERAQLGAVYAAQQAQVDAAARVRANLDALAASTQRLANGGDGNARAVVDALRARGVNINPNPVVPPSPAPAAAH